MNSEPTHFLTFINNGKAFPSIYGITCSYQCLEQFQLLPGHWQEKRYWIPGDNQTPNLLDNYPNSIRNKMKFQIKTKKNRSKSFWNY